MMEPAMNTGGTISLRTPQTPMSKPHSSRPRAASHESPTRPGTAPSRQPKTSPRNGQILYAPQPTLRPADERAAFSSHLQRPTVTQRPSTSDHRAFATPQYPHTLRKVPSEASRLRALNSGGLRSGSAAGYRSGSPSGRYTPDQTNVENFSRPHPRKRNHSPRRPLVHGSTFPLQPHTPTSINHSMALSSRERGASASVTSSPQQHPSVPLRPAVSIPDFSSHELAYPRHRNAGNMSYRHGRSHVPPESEWSTQRQGPLIRAGAVETDEVRASFKSQLTTSSSFLDASGTERSSVITKSSSATSIYGRDEGMSVDDAIGMYETGFADSGAEDGFDSRPSSGWHIAQTTTIPADEARAPSPEPLPELTRERSHSDTPPGRPGLEGNTLTSQHLSNADRRTVWPQASPVTPGSEGPIPPRKLPSFDRAEPDRDRYGFKKKSQHVSLEQYEAWEGDYNKYVERRTAKWVALMKDSGLPTQNPHEFPPVSGKVQRFVRKGIPPKWRGAAWFWYARGPTMMAKNRGVYKDLVERAERGDLNPNDAEIIERDLHRTFPDNIHFKPDPSPQDEAALPTSNGPQTSAPETEIVRSLRRVLHAFSIYNRKIGYCQSLNFIAGLLLLFMDEEKAFWVLCIITMIYLPGTHEISLEGANVDLGVLMMSIKETMPAIWAKIGGELDGSAGDGQVSMRLPPITLCMTAWFMSCFIGTLPIETTLRVWDSFFYEGSKTIFRVALAIFKVGEQEIRAVHDPMEIFQVVQTIPRRLIDANVLMEVCFKRRNGIVRLTQSKVEDRRKERRQAYADEHARVAGQTAVGRKNTLFRKKNAPKTAL